MRRQALPPHQKQIVSKVVFSPLPRCELWDLDEGSSSKPLTQLVQFERYHEVPIVLQVERERAILPDAGQAGDIGALGH